MGNKKYIKKIVDDYCVLDTETTGLSSYYDEVIEIGILRVRENQIVDRYSQLIKPEYEIDPFITELTGITNEMVAGMPNIMDVKDKVIEFLGEDIIIGHNTSFDIRFLNAGFHYDIPNSYMDTVQFSRKLFPELDHHRLSDMTEYLGLSNNEHRAMADCVATKELYDSIKNEMKKKSLEVKDLWQYSYFDESVQIKSIVPTTPLDEVNKDGFFYGKHVVFTGKLERMSRKDAMQLIVNRGAILDNSVGKKTNYLILGDNDYNPILHGEKSSKQKKAEQLKLEGNDIDIIDEKTFYDILDEE